MDKTKSELPLIGRKGMSKSKNKRNKDKMTKEKNYNFDKQNEEENDELKKEKLEKEQKFKNIENTIEESGLPMAFNVIFSELISKQIMPENYFTYTSLRLKEIGKEIQGLKDKDPIYIERLKEKIPEKRFKTEGDKVIKKDDIFMTAQKK